VDCFYEGENMLVIHPDGCIDCGVCEPECPVEAIKPDTEPGLEKWLGINAEYAKAWPNISVKKEPPADAFPLERLFLIADVLSFEVGLSFLDNCLPLINPPDSGSSFEYLVGAQSC
jgi:ferredoxin